MVVLCTFYVSCILSNILIFNNIEYNCVGSFQVVIPESKFFDDMARRNPMLARETDGKFFG